MRLGTKILLLMLLITIGSSAVVSWIVTINVTRYETQRASDQISVAISRYLRHLDNQYQQISRIVRALMEAPAQRSLLQAAADPADPSAREQLKQEVFGRDVQTELQSREGTPAFHVLINLAHEVVLVAATDPSVAEALSSGQIRWPDDAVQKAGSQPVIQYLATPAGLFLAMGIPLRTQLDEPPDHAYFVGFRVDNNWVRQQLLAEQRAAPATAASLAAWFIVNGRVVARATSDSPETRIDAFRADAPLHHVQRAGDAGAAPTDQFDVGGERFLGQSFELSAAGPALGHLVLASSLDRSLAPLRHLQRQILWTALGACAVAVIACRAIAMMIARPIQQLVAGTHRIAGGQFDNPVQIQRHDELGALADSFNEMALGLKERDALREDRVKLERDLALARKIQMDVLPRELPPCPGYELAALSLPAEQTGGDIYDLIAIVGESSDAQTAAPLMLLLADATGHGIGAALSVTQVRSMLRIGVRLRAGLDDVLSQINRQLCQDLASERFVTAFLGLLDPSAHRLSYHSAGQAPLLHFHAGAHRFEWLNSSMIPLGIDEDAQSDGLRFMSLEPGDLVVLLTDGFYEYCNDKGDYLGQERVAEMIMQHHHLPANQLLDKILAATSEFAGGAPQLDDMSALIVRRLPVE